MSSYEHFGHIELELFFIFSLKLHSKFNKIKFYKNYLNSKFLPLQYGLLLITFLMNPDSKSKIPHELQQKHSGCHSLHIAFTTLPII